MQKCGILRREGIGQHFGLITLHALPISCNVPLICEEIIVKVYQTQCSDLACLKKGLHLLIKTFSGHCPNVGKKLNSDLMQLLDKL